MCHAELGDQSNHLRGESRVFVLKKNMYFKQYMYLSINRLGRTAVDGMDGRLQRFYEVSRLAGFIVIKICVRLDAPLE